MNRALFLIPLLLSVSIGLAYAEPLDTVNTEILEIENNSATVQISWNQDGVVSQYEVGCVSCSPNISETTTENSIILSDVTAVGDKSVALLYVIAYDSDNEVIKANQIFVELK